MASPFNIEEIFPDVTAAPVRLPRRQVGSSPQGLAVTLVADYTLRTRTWLPSAAIVALLSESGVTSGGARTAISRLYRRGVLEGRREGRQSSYRLTQPAVTSLSIGGGQIAAFAAQDDSWDDLWTLIAFSLPQEKNTQRRTLRGQLRWLGYAPLYDGLWVCPHDLTPKARAELAGITLGAMTVFRSRHVELEAATSRNPIEAWDIADIARQYTAFVRRWEQLPPRIRAGDVTGAEAVRARTGVMDTYRRFRFLDPRLPIQLMPAPWPRAAARDVFLAVYDGLAEPAQQHVRAVAARFSGDPQPDIRAHTTTDLGSGITAPPPAADRLPGAPVRGELLPSGNFQH